MTSASSLQPKAFQLLLSWTGLEAEEEESPLEKDEEKVSWEPLSMLSLPSLSSSPLSPSPLLLPPKMASPTVLTSKGKEYLQPPHLLWKCACDVWVSKSSSPTYCHRGHHQRMNQKGNQSRAIIKSEEQVHAFASTKLQKEIYSCHHKPYFEVPSWQKMTVAVSMT
jgi:hypothetical protein